MLDVNGAVIPGAGVQFSNEGTHEVRSAQTTDEGRFQFDSLADGNYSLKIEATGFKSLVIEKVFIDRNKLLNISLILELSGDTVTMGVIAYDPLIDTTDSSIKTTITSDQIRRLPIPK